MLDVNLPYFQISEYHETFPTDWGRLSYTEMMTLESIFPETLEKAQKLERETIGQAENKLWMSERSNRITSSNAHKINIRKRNFDSLASSMLSAEPKKMPKFVQDAMKFGRV